MSDQDGTQVNGGNVDDIPVEGTTLDGGATEGTADSDSPAGAKPGERKASNLQDLVDEPAKVMRIGTMIRQLLEEVKSAPLDQAARGRLAEIHERSIKELEDGLAPELVEELERISLPFPEHTTPSDAELRIAQAQLVGWLEGLFHGIQTAIAAQQAAREHAVAQLQLRQLPPGTMIAPGVVIGENGEPQRAHLPGHEAEPGKGPRMDDPDHGPGQYL
ncbi:MULTISPECIES: bacterial proteasome activator family protein [Arthrobacter]|uniref:Bacterial proteasome activator n=1 Tax=Arthrobacter terricola TaxID=2547396 RepID=A0A4R5K8U9_9MICC|nr:MULTISPECIES: bacterial proteasome activator family protein [Arthrobacter]MBT8163099.1 bacterial proteasome activator family protein [Arthrobacter sp. GN70]TDF87910.1 bacterial proteasome activator family protein [Arthrobacter terricola]